MTDGERGGADVNCSICARAAALPDQTRCRACCVTYGLRCTTCSNTHPIDSVLICPDCDRDMCPDCCDNYAEYPDHVVCSKVPA